MNSEERIRCAMLRQQPDRVPLWCQLSMGHIVRFGTTDGEYPETIEGLVEAECRLARRYRFDGMVVYLPAMRRGTQLGGFLRQWAEGTSRPVNDNDFATADPEKWTCEEPAGDCDPAGLFSSHLAREILGPDIHVGGWSGDAFSCAIQWFPSLEGAMLAIAVDPERFEALVRYFERPIIHGVRNQIRVGGLQSIQISSPYAGSSFISRESYESLVLPQLTRLAAAIRQEKAFSYVHTCGFLGDRLELLAASGVDGIECMDPPPLGDVELADAKRRVGDKVCLRGNLDPVNLLLRGSDEEFEAKVRECLNVGMPGGGYILSSACSVSPGVQPARMDQLARLIDRYGVY